MDVTTYYAEATIVATGVDMCDDGLTAAQLAQLQDAERRGVIRELRYMVNGADVQAMFRGSVDA